MFGLGDSVRIGSGLRDAALNVLKPAEQGRVIARAQYERNENQYLVRYNNANGCLVEQWWGESALSY